MRHVSRRLISLIAWSVAAASAASMVAQEVSAVDERGVLSAAIAVGPVLAIAGIGGLLASRRPANPIGWILLAAMALLAVGPVFELSFVVALGLMATLVPLLFPTGHPPMPRWRWVGWIAAVGLVLVGLLAVLEAVLGEEPWLATIAIPALAVVAVAVLASFSSLVVRFRRSDGVERLQLRWVTFAFVLTFLGTFLSAGLSLPEQVGEIAALSLPVAIGIAILRYRLYEIDRIINRTVVYGAVVSLLVGFYVAGVIVLQELLPERGDLAVAASTLGVAALFNPLRHRIQGLVDRRFYRSRYDAQRVVEAFSARLRDEVDLESLTSELAEVVQDSVQPEIMSVWVK